MELRIISLEHVNGVAKERKMSQTRQQKHLGVKNRLVVGESQRKSGCLFPAVDMGEICVSV
jgi:hypothetical protein